jgi:hypothetical protein
MTSSSNKVGKCRICGKTKRLTKEHIIPRIAGGGKKSKLYSGDELLKILRNDGSKPYGKIEQGGYAPYTLCSDCNNLSGRLYDNDFALFANMFTEQIIPKIGVPENIEPADYLDGKNVDVTICDMKPLNIAKRILVSLCSVPGMEGLTDKQPEIRKAILDKDYLPDVKNFSLYLGLNTGNMCYMPTQKSFVSRGNVHFTETIVAGIEGSPLSIYLAPSNEDRKVGSLAKCIDITNWLTNYKYDEIANLQLILKFNKSFSVRFKIPTD